METGPPILPDSPHQHPPFQQQPRWHLLKGLVIVCSLLLSALLLFCFTVEQVFMGKLAYMDQWLIDMLTLRMCCTFLLLIAVLLFLSERLVRFAVPAVFICLGTLAPWMIFQLSETPTGLFEVLVAGVLFWLTVLLTAICLFFSWRSNFGKGLMHFGSVLGVIGIVLFLVHFLFTPTRVTSASGLKDGVHKRGSADGTYREIVTKGGKYVSITTWTSTDKRQLADSAIYNSLGDQQLKWEYDSAGRLIRLYADEHNLSEWYGNGRRKRKIVYRKGDYMRKEWYESGQIKDSFCFDDRGKIQKRFHFNPNGQLHTMASKNLTRNWYANGQKCYERIEKDGWVTWRRWDSLGVLESERREKQFTTR